MSEENRKISNIISRLFIKIKRILKSMKLRIFIAIIIAGMIPAIIVQPFIGRSVEREMKNTKVDKMLGQCNIIREQISVSDFFTGDNSKLLDSDFTEVSAMNDGRIMVIDNNFNIVKDTYVIDEGKVCVSSDVLKAYKGKSVTRFDEKNKYIEISIPIYDNEKHIEGVLCLTASTKDVEMSVNNIQNRQTIITLILFLIIVLFAYIICNRLVRPFKKLEKTFEKVSEGYLDNKLALDGYTETEQIATSYNDMLDKMKIVDESREEFVSNVSHELKTPMTSIKVLADSLTMQENVPSEIYKEFFEDIVKEIDRENLIISNLLTLVRTDKKNGHLNIESVNINELVEAILKRVRPLATQKNVEIVLESFRPVIASVDQLKLTSAITNLVENAVKYNVMDGWVRVTLNADHKYFYIKVADSGIGIPSESKDRVFERFYRVDKARSRQTGGTGLGLAITSNIIKMHNGAIKVYSKEGEGTTFIVRIPLNYVNNETYDDYKDEIAGDIDEKESELQEENGEKSLEEKIYLYYINKDETKLVKTVYTPDKTDDVLKQTKNVIRQMNKTSKEVNVITAKPEDVKINNISYLDSIITIDFTSDYEEMTPVREVLLRSAIVLTVSQIDGVGGVAFTVNGENLTNNSDVPVGIMNAASIVDNIGNNTDNLTKVDADIYFGDSSGSRLKAYRYIGSCDQNTSAEKLIIEKLIAGNNGEDYTRTIPKDTTLLSVVTKDGICYVNFDAKFNSESSDIVPQIQIYSVVNSLCELPYINKVQISINGLTNEKLGGEISLNKLFERNLDLVSK